MSFLNKKLSSLFLILVVGNIFPYNAIATGKHQHQQSHTEKDYAYKIIQDTIIKNGKIEVHNDTVFNPAYTFKKITTSTNKIADTIWQDANVFTINYRYIEHYDYVPTDPAYGYIGKIKMAKPYSFFRPSEKLNLPRVGLVAGMQAGLYAIANVWWSTAWYSKTEKTKFHFFNDWNEWNNMDKTGHCFSSYIESKWTYDLFKWAGLQEKHAIWVGMLTGNMWQLSIELHDGFQKKWGFSWSDMSMNISGSLLFGVQQYLWHDQRITMKISAFPVNYSKYNDAEIKERANKLYGTSFSQTMLKDYNAQTYWWSISPGAFVRNPNSKFPKWLQFSFGYGAGGMLGGYANKWNKNDLSGDEDLSKVDPADIVDRSDIQRLHRFYLSVDLDWTKLPVKRHWAKGLMKVLNVIKLPAPAIEFNDNKHGSKVAWHWLKF
ncbi:MAG: hypothetical protein RJA25_1640 [Bacteroidota bacterium]|jgi:hypothetical protein